MADKLIDPSNLKAPLPAWRWLFWFVPEDPNRMPSLPYTEYLVGGSDDPVKAEEMRERNYIVRENPIWRTLN